LLQALAPAFKKFTEIVDKVIAPFLTNLPKNFEKMINKIIGGFNRFADKLNSFAEKAQRILSKIGIKIDIPKLRKFSEVDFGLGKGDVKSIVSPDDIDAQRTAAGLLATAASTATQNAPVTNNINVNVSGGGNPDEVARKTVEEVKKFTDRNGTLGRVGVGGGGSGIVIA